MLCGTKNFNKVSPDDTVQGLISIDLVFQNQFSNPNMFICRTLPGDESFLVNRLIINKVNNLVKPKYSIKRFYFINQNNGWTLNNNALGFSLCYSGGLNLVEKCNLELANQF